MATKEPTINSNRDESTELSKTRTREAADRTLMAWIRRSLFFIAFGFGIAAVGQMLERTVLARILGAGFVAVALLAVAVAMVPYRQELKMIEASDYRYKPSLPLGIISGVALFLIGLFAVVGIIIWGACRLGGYRLCPAIGLHTAWRALSLATIDDQRSFRFSAPSFEPAGDSL